MKALYVCSTCKEPIYDKQIRVSTEGDTILFFHLAGCWVANRIFRGEASKIRQELVEREFAR